MSETLDILQVIARLMKADNVLLLCHKNPDGDTIGSAAALCHALQSVGKTVAVLCADTIPARYAYMNIPLFNDSFTPLYVVSIDVAGIQLFGDSISEYSNRVDLCIDHHPSNAGFADAMLLDSSAAATAEIIYELICQMNVEITPQIADCLYTGVATDTGCFKFANTTSRTHLVAQKLMEAGANTVELNDILFQNKSRSRIEIERVALDSLQFFLNDKCAVIHLTKEQIANSGVEPSDLEGITSLPRTIEGVIVGVTMRQQPTGSYKVSVRTAIGVNASEICARLGGGGHAQASGCEIMGSFDNAQAALLAEIEKGLKKYEAEQGI